MLRISERVRHTQSEDGGIVLDPLNNRIFCLNRVGSTILGLLEQGNDEAHIAEETGRAYGVSVETVRADIHEFIQALREHHIVRPHASHELDGRIEESTE